VWYHATAEWPIGKEEPENTNLTLFVSRDAGQAWTRLRRFHFGAGDTPSVVPLGPGRCAVSFRRFAGHGDQSHQFRVVTLEGLGGN
jgi:hypothetical protein